MPTGLTYKIYDGTDMSLRSFALKCAAQFGGGYYASDSGEKSLPINEVPVLKPDDYHLNKLKESVKELVRWENFKENPEDARRLYDEEIKRRCSYVESLKVIDEELKKRYEQMIVKVVSWNVGAKLESLKDFMLRLLKDSLAHDCPDYSDIIQRETVIQPFEEWIQSHIECERQSIDIHLKGFEKELEETERNNQWLADLYTSLDKFEKEIEEICE